MYERRQIKSYQTDIFMKKFLQPADVFTPRSSVINKEMYVPRARHEAALVRAFQGTKNIIIFGESGCGKSWLYKKSFWRLAPLIWSQIWQMFLARGLSMRFSTIASTESKEKLKQETNSKSEGRLMWGLLNLMLPMWIKQKN